MLSSSEAADEGGASGDTADGGTPIAGLTEDTINISFIGADFVDFTEQWQHTGYFGFMIRDSSRGNAMMMAALGMPVHKNRMALL